MAFEYQRSATEWQYTTYVENVTDGSPVWAYSAILRIIHYGYENGDGWGGPMKREHNTGQITRTGFVDQEAAQNAAVEHIQIIEPFMMDMKATMKNELGEVVDFWPGEYGPPS